MIWNEGKPETSGSLDSLPIRENLGHLFNSLNTHVSGSNAHNADAIDIDVIGSPPVDNVELLYDYIFSAGTFCEDIIVDGGDGTITVSSGSGFIRTSDLHNAPLISFEWASSSSIAIGDDILTYVYLDYNGGSPIIKTTTDRNDISDNCEVCIGHAYKESGSLTIHTRTGGLNTCDITRRVDKRIKDLRNFERCCGMVTSETGIRNIAITAGEGWRGLDYFTTLAKNTSGSADTFTYWYRDGAGGWTQVSGSTQIDNTQYDDGSGTLATLSTTRYGVHWVFLCHDPQSDIDIVYGQGDYKLAEVLNAEVPSGLPDKIDYFDLIIARIIIKKNDATFTEVATAFEIYFPRSEVINHNDLGNIQGGQAGEYYHLKAAEHSALVDGGSADGYHTHPKSGSLDTLDSVCERGAETDVPITVSASGSVLKALRVQNDLQVGEALLSKKIEHIVYADHYSSAQAAVDDLPADGGMVMFPSGTYEISAAINIPSNVYLKGVGKSSVIQAASGTTQFIATTGTVEDIKVSDLWFKGDDSSTLLGFDHINNGVLSNIWLSNVGDSCGIGVEYCNYFRVVGCYVDKSPEGDAGNGIHVVYSTEVIVEKNKVVGAGGTGIVIDHSSYRCVVVNNSVSGSAAVEISVHDNSRNVVIQNNVIAGRGIYGSLYLCDTVSDVMVVNNTVYGGNRGFRIDNATDCIVTNNVIDTVDEHGLWITSGSRNIVSNNIFKNCGGRGIYVEPEAVDYSFFGNRFYNNVGGDIYIGDPTLHKTTSQSPLFVDVSGSTFNSLFIEDELHVVNDSYFHGRTWHYADVQFLQTWQTDTGQNFDLKGISNQLMFFVPVTGKNVLKFGTDQWVFVGLGLQINSNHNDADAILEFGKPTSGQEDLRWNKTNTRFEFSDNLYVDGDIEITPGNGIIMTDPADGIRYRGMLISGSMVWQAV